MRLMLAAMLALSATTASAEPAAPSSPQQAGGSPIMIAPPEPTTGAEAFVRALYRSYSDGDDADPWSGDQLWSRRMAALVRRDQELSNGDLPYLDADPICSCQDWGQVSVRSVALALQPDGAVNATVRFTNFGEEKISILRLVMERYGWRVDDVLNPDYPSLAENLAASNARIEAGGKALGRD